VAACFAEDLELLQQLAHFLADKHPEYGRALPDTLMEVRRLLEHEVDFVREQATLLQAARMYKGMRGVRVPRLFAPLSTATITALSEEEGVKITALADAPGRQRRRAAEQLVEALIAVPLFARGERSIFHADPHAGNLLYDERKGELVLLDWALTESLTREERRHVALLALMLGLRDPVGVCGEIEALALGRRIGAAHRDFMRDHVNQFIGQLPFSRLPSSMDAMRLLDRLALEGIRFPSGLMMFRKVLFMLDGILHDIAAPNLHMDMILARHMLARSPLGIVDWIGVEASALLYGGRLWVQWAQSALSRAQG
jgi:ubiquinone biosynthesis protein